MKPPRQVEMILGKRFFQKQTQYLIKWKNCSMKYNSWEPKQNFNSPKLLKTFEEKCKKAADMSSTQTVPEGRVLRSTISKPKNLSTASTKENETVQRKDKATKCLPTRSSGTKRQLTVPLQSAAIDTSEDAAQQNGPKRRRAASQPAIVEVAHEHHNGRALRQRSVNADNIPPQKQRPAATTDDEDSNVEEESDVDEDAPPFINTPETRRQALEILRGMGVTTPPPGYDMSEGESDEEEDEIDSDCSEFDSEPYETESGEEEEEPGERGYVSGFDRGLKPDYIMAAIHTEEDNFFLVKWKESSKADLVRMSEANERCPEMVISWYQSTILWNQ